MEEKKVLPQKSPARGKKTAVENSKKETVKKTKTASTKSKTTKAKLNETVNVAKNTQAITKILPSNENEIECIYCHNKFEKGMTICPYCRKRQKSSNSLIYFLIASAIFITVTICSHIVNNYIINPAISEEEYKESCELMSYENLVRKPKDYKGKDVRVIGKVVDIVGTDNGFGNDMTITIDAGLFNDDAKSYIKITFLDTKYEQGFLIGDMLTIYGTYSEINGNIPTISAKYIVLG